MDMDGLWLKSGAATSAFIREITGGALNLLVPGEALTIILLANNEDFDLWGLGQTLLNQALDEPREAEREADGSV